jgi:small subunit ribosomal protein S20
VAHSLSAKKRVRQNLKRRARNRARKELIKDQVKVFSTAITGGDFGKAETELRKVTQRLDRVAGKGAG